MSLNQKKEMLLFLVSSVIAPHDDMVVSLHTHIHTHTHTHTHTGGSVHVQRGVHPLHSAPCGLFCGAKFRQL